MKRIIASALCILLVFSLSGCSRDVVWNGKTEAIARLSMVQDISDMRKYIGMVDYVFIGTVEEIIDDVLPSKIKKHEDYYSSYKIHVDYNLKGELVDEVTVSKMGGYKKDGTMCIVSAETPTGKMINDSGLPELNKQYVFMAYAQSNGSLTLSEIFDNREYSNALLEEYLDYIDNEIVFDRERFISKYAK